jgi:hypothetical protein
VKLYADTIGRRTWHLFGDLMVLGWVVFWVWFGTLIYQVTSALAVPGEKLEQAGDEMSTYLNDAGDAASDLPLLGDELRTPFDGAGSASAAVAQAGRDQQDAVMDLALVLGVAVAAAPILIALLIWLPIRIRFVRRATAAQHLIDAEADLDLFALRALARQPMHVLGRISDDPAGAWRRRDPAVVHALAAVELRKSGLRLPPGLSSTG